jgi:hypothetical protein
VTRELTAIVEAAVSGTTLTPFIGVEMFFVSGTVRLWFGIGDLTIDGRTFTGAGALINISEVEETAQLQASGVTLTLSGIPTTLIATAISEPYQGRVCNIYFGVVTPTPSMSVVFSGFIDQMVVTDTSDACTIAVTVENKLIDLERPRSRRYTDEDQKSRFPGDRGLEFVESLQTKELFWGKANPR